MKYKIMATLFAVMFAAGCSGSSTPGTGVTSESVTPKPQIPSDKTVNIGGTAYTCGQVIDAPEGKCEDGFQRAFNAWGDNINAYMESGRLGPLGGNLKTDANPDALMRYEDVAASGLGACILAAEGTGMLDSAKRNEFIDWLLKSYPDQPRTVFLPLWFGANRHLCPDVENDKSYKSEDFVVP